MARSIVNSDKTQENETGDVSESESIFLDYVRNKIAEMKGYANLGENMIGFAQLNLALASHFDITMTLIELYNISKRDYQNQKEIFDMWYSNTYTEIRQKENPKTLSAQKWLSSKEIDSLLRVKYQERYLLLSRKLNELESGMSFIEQLIRAWDGQKFVLNTLSKNIQTEFGGIL